MAGRVGGERKERKFILTDGITAKIYCNSFSTEVP